jgi:hypothetical protein
MTRLEQLHQCESNDEAYGRPFEASQSSVKHPGSTVAQAIAALKPTRPRQLLHFALGQSSLLLALGLDVYGFAVRLGRERVCQLEMGVDCNPAICLRSPP